MDSKAPGPEPPEPTDLTSQTWRLARNTLSPRSTLTLVATLGTVLMGVLAFVRILLVDGVAVLPILILAMPVLLSALAVAARWRWAPLFAAVMVLITTGLPLAGQQDAYELLHPAQFVPFLLGVIALAVALVAIVAGVTATIQNYRGVGETSHLPHWSTFSLGGLATMVLGILLVH